MTGINPNAALKTDLTGLLKQSLGMAEEHSGNTIFNSGEGDVFLNELFSPPEPNSVVGELWEPINNLTQKQLGFLSRIFDSFARNINEISGRRVLSEALASLASSIKNSREMKFELASTGSALPLIRNNRVPINVTIISESGEEIYCELILSSANNEWKRENCAIHSLSWEYEKGSGSVLNLKAGNCDRHLDSYEVNTEIAKLLEEKKVLDSIWEQIIKPVVSP